MRVNHEYVRQTDRESDKQTDGRTDRLYSRKCPPHYVGRLKKPGSQLQSKMSACSRCLHTAVQNLPHDIRRSRRRCLRRHVVVQTIPLITCRVIVIRVMDSKTPLARRLDDHEKPRNSQSARAAYTPARLLQC